jgi:tetratricopeptide (TPR) repeat protein
MLAAALLLVAAASQGGTAPDRTNAPGAVGWGGVDGATAGDVQQTVAALQRHLRVQPRDQRGWATLGIAYVEQARVTGDATYYPKAQEVLDRAHRLNPGDDLALTGAAVLAVARHQFRAALRLADQALAVNPYSAAALLARVDALVELGRYDEATAAARHADDVQPGLPSFARLSYLAELRGDLAAANRLMARALDSAQRPSDVAFARVHLGDLARVSGDLDAATEHYAAALATVPAMVGAMTGQARVALARGNTEAALPLLEQAAQRLPLPENLTLLGETYQSLGRPREADAQYAVVRATVQLASRQGVGTDLETALFEADHGSAAAALGAARREWTRRHSVHAADALAWALHANGRDHEALRYAQVATRLGTRDPGFLFHRGMIRKSLGQVDAARQDLVAALRHDAGFSPLHRERARQALAALGARP